MINVRRSTVIAAPIEAVWRILRDFNSHHLWHPAIAESEIENGRASDEIGCVRRFRLTEGGILREQLLRLSDRDHAITYCILEAPLQLIGYVATLQLRPISDGNQTYWEWRSSFDAPPQEAAALAELVGEGIYVAGFDAIKRYFASGRTNDRSRPAIPVAVGGTMTSQAMVLDRHGGPEVLHRRNVAVPPPQAGEIRVSHSAIGVNFIDVYCRTGFFPMVEPGGVIGMEAAGTVLDVGPGIHHLLPGDRVAYACAPPGAYAEIRCIKADLVVPLPEDIADEIAAALMLKGMTAAFLLHRIGRLTAGQTVLVHAAAGGVGQFLCQWAQALGATVIGTVGSTEKARFARENGCAYPILYREADFVTAVREITSGRGCDIVFDAVGRDTFLASCEALAPCGHLISYGQASGPIPPVDVNALAQKSLTLSRPAFGDYCGTPEDVRSLSALVFAAYRQQVLQPTISARLPLVNAPEAHRALESRETIGASILVP